MGRRTILTVSPPLLYPLIIIRDPSGIESVRTGESCAAFPHPGYQLMTSTAPVLNFLPSFPPHPPPQTFIEQLTPKYIFFKTLSL